MKMKEFGPGIRQWSSLGFPEPRGKQRGEYHAIFRQKAPQNEDIPPPQFITEKTHENSSRAHVLFVPAHRPGSMLTFVSAM